MKRRPFLFCLGAAALAPAAWLATRGERATAREDAVATPAVERLRKTPAEWKALLSPAAYSVLFEEATERAGSSPLNDEHRPGTYCCAACFLPLFDAAHKYESGTGWPSFFTHLPGVMGTKRDWKLIYPRTEYHCIRCGGHQGQEIRGQVLFCHMKKSARNPGSGLVLPHEEIRGQRNPGSGLVLPHASA